MFARLALLSAGVAVAGLLAVGCGPKKAPPAPRVALVGTTAGFGDHGFNDAARAGLAECRRDTGIETDAIIPSSDDDAEAQMVLYATERYDAVIGLGYSDAQGIQDAAKRFDEVHFAIVDAFGTRANLVSINFNEAQGAFLAGALAALVSRTHHVAFVGGADVPLIERSEAGFSAGAREADPHVRVDVRYLDTFTDSDSAHETAGALLNGGADIIFAVAGPAGLGVFDAVKERPHAYAIGADVDEDALAPGKILTSVVKHVDVAVLHVCLDTAGLKPETGPVVLGLADDGIGLTDFTYTRALIGARTLARIDRLRAAVVSGRIAVPASRVELAHFRPVAVP
jgi:basic membrane protein A